MSETPARGVFQLHFTRRYLACNEYLPHPGHRQRFPRPGQDELRLPNGSRQMEISSSLLAHGAIWSQQYDGIHRSLYHKAETVILQSPASTQKESPEDPVIEVRNLEDGIYHVLVQQLEHPARPYSSSPRSMALPDWKLSRLGAMIPRRTDSIRSLPHGTAQSLWNNRSAARERRRKRLSRKWFSMSVAVTLAHYRLFAFIKFRTTLGNDGPGSNIEPHPT